RSAEAIEHAASAGRRGAVKVVFDMRGDPRRLSYLLAEGHTLTEKPGENPGGLSTHGKDR
ncbi:MAG: hypothetical protein ACYCXN_09900, partial [Acidimicrobiales bacterium]